MSSSYLKLVSVIIVNFNGARWLQNCLESLSQQTLTDIEIIIVDNGSSDESHQIINKYRSCVVIKLDYNAGFAKANNIGYALSHGKYVFFLNNDTVSSPNLLQDLVLTMDEQSIDCAQPVILSGLGSKHQVIDSCGSYWTLTGLLYHYGRHKSNISKYMHMKDVFTVKGAAMMVRSDVIKRLDLFDEKFWCYYEETDFCHRLILSGYRVTFVPVLSVLHFDGGTSRQFSTTLIFFHDTKNKIRSYLKNYQIITLVFLLPTFLFINLMYAIVQTLRLGKNYLSGYINAITWNYSNIQETIYLRAKIQKNRTKYDAEYLRKVMFNPSIKYYYLLAIGKLSTYVD